MKIIGHRGACAHAPENTLASIHAAIDQGVDMLEIDVHLVEGNVIVFHDFTVDRMTDETGELKSYAFDELRKLKVEGKHQIPTLDEVLELLAEQAPEMVLNVELKGVGVVDHSLILVQGCGALHKVIFSSFDWFQLEQLRSLSDDVRIAVLVDDEEKWSEAVELAKNLRAVAVNPSVNLATQERVEESHQKGLLVYSYTVRTDEDWERVVEAGVDGCFVDDPEWAFGKWKCHYVNPIKLDGCSAASDGGSLGLHFIDASGREFDLTIDRAIGSATSNQVFLNRCVLDEQGARRMRVNLKQLVGTYDGLVDDVLTEFLGCL